MDEAGVDAGHDASGTSYIKINYDISFPEGE